MLHLTEDAKKYIKEKRIRLERSIEGIFFTSEGDVVLEVDRFLSDIPTLKEEVRESNKEYKRYLEFKAMKDKNISCFIGCRGDYRSGSISVEPKVWEKVKTAYIKAGYEVIEAR